jgi:multisubunit Na+/H+ antiporter MnhB subunit
MLLALVLIILLVIMLSGRSPGWDRAEPVGFVLSIILGVLVVLLLFSLLGPLRL